MFLILHYSVLQSTVVLILLWLIYFESVQIKRENQTDVSCLLLPHADDKIIELEFIEICFIPDPYRSPYNNNETE